MNRRAREVLATAASALSSEHKLLETARADLEQARTDLGRLWAVVDDLVTHASEVVPGTQVRTVLLYDPYFDQIVTAAKTRSSVPLRRGE